MILGLIGYAVHPYLRDYEKLSPIAVLPDVAGMVDYWVKLTAPYFTWAAEKLPLFCRKVPEETF